MKLFENLPVAIKVMIILVFVDVSATISFFYFDTLYDPDVEFSDLETIISFVFPLLYFAGMVWLVRMHSPITKIVLYVVFALEFTAFIIDLEVASFDIFSSLSFISIMALFTCISILHSEVGKKWFVSKKT